MGAMSAVAHEELEEELALDEVYRFESDPQVMALERSLSFNVFVAAGIARAEVRHSAFLAALLDPCVAHGLGAKPLRLFLEEVARLGAFGSGLVPSEDKLAGAEIRREWQHIDLLIVIHDARLVVAVENKIDAGEHDDQLSRYWDNLNRYFHQPHYKLVGLYLTLDGGRPSHPEFLPVSHAAVASMIRALLVDVPNGGVRFALEQYLALLEVHLMPDTRIAQEARSLYRRHKKLFDLVFAHRPSVLDERSELLFQLIESESRIVAASESTPEYVRFVPRAWQDLPGQRSGGKWLPDRELLAFEFREAQGRFELGLILGPGDQALRRSIYEDFVAQQRPPAVPELNSDWTVLWRMTVQTARTSEAGLDSLRSVLPAQWRSFTDEVLGKLIAWGERCPALAETFEARQDPEQGGSRTDRAGRESA